MVKLRTVQGWGFSCLEYEVNDEGEVNKIICKICREFYSTEQEQKKLANKYKGSEKFLEQANAYVNGSSVVTTRLLLCVQKKNCRHIAAGSGNYGSIFVLPINLLNCEGWGHYTLNYGNGHLLIRLNWFGFFQTNFPKEVLGDLSGVFRTFVGVWILTSKSNLMIWNLKLVSIFRKCTCMWIWC